MLPGATWRVMMCHAMWQTKNQPKGSARNHFDLFWSFLYSFVKFTPGFVSWQAFGIGHDASTCHRWVIESWHADWHCRRAKQLHLWAGFAMICLSPAHRSNRKVVLCCCLNLFQGLWLSVRHAPHCTMWQAFVMLSVKSCSRMCGSYLLAAFWPGESCCSTQVPASGWERQTNP